MPPVAVQRKIIVALARQTGWSAHFLTRLPGSELLAWWSSCAELLKESEKV